MGVRWAAVLLVGWLASGCLESSAVQCEGGRACPRGTACDEAHRACVLPDQLTSCVGMDDGVDCTVRQDGDGICDLHVCVLERCGDGLVTRTEDCDGDNLSAATCESLGAHQPGTLRCNASCAFDMDLCGERCGDKIVNGPDGREECDGDAALELTCDDEAIGFYDEGPVTCTGQCTYNVSQCTGSCGDGERNGPEDCDGADPEQVTCVDLGRDAGRPRCSPFCTPSASDCSLIGWRVTSSGSTQDLLGVWVASETRAFAVGAGGAVQRFDGSSWVGEDSGTSASLRGVWGTGSGANELVLAVGDSARLLRRTATGWIADDSPVIDATYAGVWGAAADDAWAVGLGGVIVHFDGRGWDEETSPTGQDLLAVWGSGPDDVWAAGEDGTLVHRDAGGWSAEAALPSGVSDITDLWGLGPDDVWATGAPGEVYHFHDGTWDEVPLATPVVARALWGTAPNNLFAVGGSDLEHYDGVEWTSRTRPTTLYAVDGTSVRNVLGVGALGRVARYQGARFLDLEPVGLNVRRIWGSSADDVYGVLGGTMAIYHRAADGVWSLIPGASLPDNEIRNAVWGTGPDDVFVGGTTMIHRSSGGWASQALPAGQTVTGLWGDGPLDVFAVVFNGSSQGGVLHYDGAWSAQSVPTTTLLRDLWGSDSLDVFAVGVSGTILHYDGAWVQQESPIGSELTGVWGTGPDDVFAVSANGEILHHDGAEWTLMPAPVLGQLREIWGTAHDDVFAGHDSALLHYDGEAWTPVRMGPNVLLNAIWGLPDGRVALGGVGGNGAQTGVTWLERQTLWHCERATETDCDDGIDDDCDDRIDTDDPDC